MKNVVTDADQAILEEKYEFIPAKKKPISWQDRMVEKYQNGLYKEYTLADLSQPGKVGLRWRTKKEVLEGIGERTCGNKACMATARLITLRVPFAYVEQGVSKMDIVKLRLCPKCEPLVNKKKPRKGIQPISKRAEIETVEGQQQIAIDTKPEASNKEHVPPNSRENRQNEQYPLKDKKVRDRDDGSEDEEKFRRRKRKRKSHRSGDSRRSRHSRRR